MDTNTLFVTLTSAAAEYEASSATKASNAVVALDFPPCTASREASGPLQHSGLQWRMENGFARLLPCVIRLRVVSTKSVKKLRNLNYSRNMELQSKSDPTCMDYICRKNERWLLGAKLLCSAVKTIYFRIALRQHPIHRPHALCHALQHDIWDEVQHAISLVPKVQQCWWHPCVSVLSGLQALQLMSPHARREILPG